MGSFRNFIFFSQVARPPRYARHLVLVPPCGMDVGAWTIGAFFACHPHHRRHPSIHKSTHPVSSNSCASSFISPPSSHLRLDNGCPTPQIKKIILAAARAVKEKLWPFGARIFGFWRGFGEGAGLNNPVTEPKRSQNPKRPLF